MPLFLAQAIVNVHHFFRDRHGVSPVDSGTSRSESYIAGVTDILSRQSERIQEQADDQDDETVQDASRGGGAKDS